MAEKPFIRTDAKYGKGFVIDEYRGQVKLIAAREANNGKIYETWGDIEIKKDEKKRLPVGIDLGPAESVIQTMQGVMDMLRRLYPVGESRPSSLPDDYMMEDPPF